MSRQKQVFTRNELPHVFARQTQASGRTQANNFFFENTVIYSYGYHFPIAKILDNNIVLFTNSGYSKTTAKHIAAVRYALNHKRLIYCDNPAESLQHNLVELAKDIRLNFNDYDNTRKRQHTREAAGVRIKEILTNAHDLCEAFGTTLDKETKRIIKTGDQNAIDMLPFQRAADFSLDIAAASAKFQARIKRAENKREKELKAKAAEKLQLWLDVECPTYHLIQQYTPVMLRCRDEIVETTKGARVSVKAAKVLFDMIKSGRDVIGHNIDGFTVISINGVIKIGCHEIPMTEVDRFAKTMGW